MKSLQDACELHPVPVGFVLCSLQQGVKNMPRKYVCCASTLVVPNLTCCPYSRRLHDLANGCYVRQSLNHTRVSDGAVSVVSYRFAGP